MWSDNKRLMRNYNKALKKLAAQISRTIKPNITYRNIPFGFSQLDLHTDGETTLVAVKVFERSKEMKIREFQIPASELRKFLISDEMLEIFNPIDGMNVLMKDYIVKPISQGVSQIMHHSENNKETWVFPFYKKSIVFTKRMFYSDNGVNAVALRGNIYMVDLSRKNSVSFPNQVVEGYENCEDVYVSLEYRIFNALTKLFSDYVLSGPAYLEIDRKISIVAA